MKILFLGDIVGKGGILTLKAILSQVKDTYNIDFTIAQSNGVTGGFGMGRNHALQLHKLGVDCMTSGECVYYKRDIVPFIGKCRFLLKPANLPPGTPGRGWSYFDVGQHKIAVVSMIGQSSYNKMHGNNPYTYIPDLVKRIKQQTPTVIFNFNALTTAEKQSMFHLVDGHLAAMIGSGTRGLSADGEVSSKGTAYITDVGRTGSLESVAGLDPEIEINKHLRQILERSRDCTKKLELQGVVLEIDPETGRALSIETLRVPWDKEKLD